jgi:hypothetical protein
MPCDDINLYMLGSGYVLQRAHGDGTREVDVAPSLQTQLDHSHVLLSDDQNCRTN